jgi:hypothetical protein
LAAKEIDASMTGTLVPRTYFLEDAANLARESLLNRLDPALGYQPYFRLDLGGEIPKVLHASWDYCDMAGRFVDALILTAPMVGASGPSDAELGLREFLLGRVNPRDGLCYDGEAPWSKYAADMFCQGRSMIGLISLFLLTGSARVEEKVAGQITGLSKIATWDGDRAFYAKDIWIEDHFEEGGLWNHNVPGYSTQQNVGLARYARATGDPAALKLARGLSLQFKAAGPVQEDGTFKGHTHSQGILPSLLGALQYALVADDEDLAIWCQRAYEHARRFTSSFGWIPDGLGFDVSENIFAGSCETCALCDLLEMAITLTEAGLGSYWDDIDRYARNQLLEQQIRDVSKLATPEVLAQTDPIVPKIMTGAFDSAAHANSLVGDRHGVVEGCCTPAGARACMLVWDRILSRERDGIHINLMYSRDTPYARLISSEPYMGEFRVEILQAGTFVVRLPSWIQSHQVRLTLDGADRPARYRAGSIVLGDARPGQIFVLSYPQLSREETDVIAGQEYTTSWRGGYVTSITPTGGRYPTYQRSAFEAETPPMIERTPIVRPVVVNW